MSFEFCGKCTKGYIVKDERAIQCTCLKQEKLRLKMIEANIYEDYHQWLDLKKLNAPATPQQKKAREVVVDYVNNIRDRVREGRGVYFYTPERGTGKTTHLFIILKAALQAGFSVYNIHWSDLLNIMIHDHDEVERLRSRVDVLMIDELGKEGMKDLNFPRAVLDYIFRYRISRRKPVYAASNLELTEFDEKYGTGIKSLLERKIQILPMHGPDWNKANKT